jgi:hypothetical protein
MKQTTMKFTTKNPERVTIQRLQEAIDLIAKTKKGNQSIQGVGLSSNFVGYLVKAKVISKISHGHYNVVEPVITRKLYYRVMNLQSKYHNKKNLKYKSVTGYDQLPKADTDMLGLVSMPSNKPVLIKRTAKPRIKNAVSLPWWKRFLLYLLNH